MPRFSADRILARMPAEIRQHPTPEGVRHYLTRESRAQGGWCAFWLAIGGGILVYAALVPESFHGIAFMLAGASLLQASLSFHRIIDLRMSDAEIADRIRRSAQDISPRG
jgi:hypothetical protein